MINAILIIAASAIVHELYPGHDWRFDVGIVVSSVLGIIIFKEIGE